MVVIKAAEFACSQVPITPTFLLLRGANIAFSAMSAIGPRTPANRPFSPDSPSGGMFDG
jgi:hypothetical protein